MSWAPVLCAALAATAGAVTGEGSIEPVDVSRPRSTVNPPVLVHESPAPYPPQLAEQRLAGEVSLLLTVDESGAVTDAMVQASTHPAFSHAALHAAARLEFSPATIDGKPVAVQLQFEYRFVAPKAVKPAERVQRAVLKGQVRSRGTRKPVSFAVVKAGEESRVEADVDGHFVLEVSPGQHIISVTASGFREELFVEALATTQQLEVVYTLLPTLVAPYETVVRAEKVRTEVSRVELRDAELREVPGTFGDPFRVVMLLPGVGSILSGVSYPVVRGSSPAATGYFLDGVRVPQLFHVLLGPAVVHPDFIDSIDFFAGNAPVRYGRLLGGVVDGRLARPRDGFHANVSLDLLNAGGFVEVPIEKTQTQISLAGRISYTALLVVPIANAVAPPGTPGLKADFWDYQGRIEQALAGGKLRLFAFGSSDTYGTQPRSEDEEIRLESQLQTVRFHRVDLRYRHALGVGEVETGLTWGLDDVIIGTRGPQTLGDLDRLESGTLTIRRSEFQIHQGLFGGRLQWSGNFDAKWSASVGGTVEAFGASFDQSEERVYLGPPRVTQNQEQSQTLSTLTMAGAWAEVAYHPVPSVRLVPGVRLDSYHLKPSVSRVSADPRLTAFWNPTASLELHAGVGEFHQAPTFLINLPVVDVVSISAGLQDAWQTSAGVRWKTWNDLELSLDGYFNFLVRTMEISLRDDDLEFGQTTVPGLGRSPAATHGVAYGVEAMAKLPATSRFFGWLTLGLARSQRYQRFADYDEYGQRQGSKVADVPFAFDQTFIANLVLSYRFAWGISVGTTLHFNTGRPETGELTSRTQIQAHDRRGRPQWVRVDTDEADRLPPFFRLDFRVSKTWLLDQFSIETYLDVLNLLVRPEVITFTYSRDSQLVLSKTATGVPVVVPNLGVKGRY